MPQQPYQEPIEKEDLDLKKKFSEPVRTPMPGAEKSFPKIEKSPQSAEPAAEKETAPVGPEKEPGAEIQKEKVSEKIETARKTIQTQKPAAKASVSDDAQTVSRTADYEKKIDKLMELALQRGPEHAIKVARHLDKGKSVFEADNYTLDEIHDKLLEDELRKQLIGKGLLKEL